MILVNVPKSFCSGFEGVLCKFFSIVSVRNSIKAF